MKKIFMFINVDWFFFSHREPIAKQAHAHQIEMSVYTDLTKSYTSPGEEKFNLIQSPLSRSSKHYLLIIEFMKAYFLIRSEKPDLIHAVTIKPILILGVISRLLGIPFIGAISGLGPVFSPETLYKKLRLKLVLILYKYVFKSKYSAVICQNTHDKDTLINSGVGNELSIEIISGSGVNLDKFKPISEKGEIPTILMASRILIEKGIIEFCSAADCINKSDSKRVKFYLAGPIDNQSPSSVTKEKINSLCEESGVTYLGDRKDLHTLIAKSDIFVLPSFYAEGVPKVLLEAASCGVPIITTNHPGCRDAIVNKKTGILVEPRDSKALASAMKGLISNPKLMFEMGKAGRKMAEDLFDEKAVIKSHYELYKKYTKSANTKS